MNETVALVLAGGRGDRLGGPEAKQYQSLAGQPMVRRSLTTLAFHPRVSAVRPDTRAAVSRAPLVSPGGVADQRYRRINTTFAT